MAEHAALDRGMQVRLLQALPYSFKDGIAKSGKAADCKSALPRFESGYRLHIFHFHVGP